MSEKSTGFSELSSTRFSFCIFLDGIIAVMITVSVCKTTSSILLPFRGLHVSIPSPSDANIFGKVKSVVGCSIRIFTHSSRSRFGRGGRNGKLVMGATCFG